MDRRLLGSGRRQSSCLAADLGAVSINLSSVGVALKESDSDHKGEPMGANHRARKSETRQNHPIGAVFGGARRGACLRVSVALTCAQ